MPPKDQTFYIKSYLNGLCVDVEGNSTDEGAKVCMWHAKPVEEAANQLWYMDPYTNTIRNAHTGFCLEVDGEWHLASCEIGCVYMIVTLWNLTDVSAAMLWVDLCILVPCRWTTKQDTSHCILLVVTREAMRLIKLATKVHFIWHTVWKIGRRTWRRRTECQWCQALIWHSDSLQVNLCFIMTSESVNSDSKIHRAQVGRISVLLGTYGPNIGTRNLAIGAPFH